MPTHGTTPAEQPPGTPTPDAATLADGPAGPTRIRPAEQKTPTPQTPAIPVQLARRPTLGGLAVPWTTARTPDGRYRFGSVDFHRNNRALTERLCQICGQPLGDRMVFALRHSDLRALTSHEPGMHPVCAAYTAAACPMISGRMQHYQTEPTSLSATLADVGITIHGDPSGARAGSPAEQWHLLWATGYHVFHHPGTQALAAIVRPDLILRVRPVTMVATPTTSCPRSSTPPQPERSTASTPARCLDAAADCTDRSTTSRAGQTRADTARPTCRHEPGIRTGPQLTLTNPADRSPSAGQPAAIVTAAPDAPQDGRDGHQGRAA